MNIRAVGFDIDGTLYPNDVLYRKSLLRALRHPRLMYHFGRLRKEIRQVRPIEDFYRLQAELLARSLGVSEERARWLIEERIYRRWEKIAAEVPLYARVREVIARLRAENLRLGVLSDFPAGPKLEAIGLGGLWDCELSAEEVGYLKPNPEPFVSLASCLGVTPEEMVFVGNHESYDVLGAKSVGMKTALIVPERKADRENEADFTFTHYSQLLDWISPGT